MAWGWSDVFKAYDKNGKRVLTNETCGQIFSDDSGCYRIIYSKEFIKYNERILPHDPRIVYIGASKGGESSSIIRRASDYLRDFERMYHHDSPGFILKQHYGFDFNSMYVQFKKKTMVIVFCESTLYACIFTSFFAKKKIEDFD